MNSKRKEASSRRKRQEGQQLSSYYNELSFLAESESPGRENKSEAKAGIGSLWGEWIRWLLKHQS